VTCEDLNLAALGLGIVLSPAEIIFGIRGEILTKPWQTTSARVDMTVGISTATLPNIEA
jgi:hypothetical protein